jgi:hypothetical protein
MQPIGIPVLWSDRGPLFPRLFAAAGGGTGVPDMRAAYRASPEAERGDFEIPRRSGAVEQRCCRVN